MSSCLTCSWWSVFSTSRLPREAPHPTAHSAASSSQSESPHWVFHLDSTQRIVAFSSPYRRNPSDLNHLWMLPPFFVCLVWAGNHRSGADIPVENDSDYTSGMKLTQSYLSKRKTLHYLTSVWANYKCVKFYFKAKLRWRCSALLKYSYLWIFSHTLV